MPAEFEPKLSILPDQQRRLWPELSAVPSSFVLVGGTAIAIQLSHRASLDFDFIAPIEFDPDELYGQIGFLSIAKVVQKTATTLICAVDRNGLIDVSFFGTPSIQLINPPLVTLDNGLRIASLLDLSAMKAAVVQKRAEAKVYVDLDAIFDQTAIDLPTALAAARVLYGTVFNPELTLKALCFFGDGNLGTLTQKVRDRLTSAVRAVDLDKLPEVKRR